MTHEADEIRAVLSKAVSSSLELRGLGYGRLGAKERATTIAGYGEAELDDVPRKAIELSSGCGHPLSQCGPMQAQTVLDVGSGGGLDLIIAGRSVGSEGKVVGVDMNADVNRLALENLKSAGLESVEVHQGLAEDLPVDDETFDLVIVNGLVALSPEQDRVFNELRRVLKPGGRAVIADIVVKDLPKWSLASRGLFHAGVTGALDIAGFGSAFTGAGFVDVHNRRHEELDENRLEAFIDGGLAGIEVAGCSASGAIMGSEAAAALTGHVAVAIFVAQKSKLE